MSNTSSTSWEKVVRAVRRDPAQFVLLMNMLAPIVIHAANKMCLHGERLQDAKQEAWLCVARALPKVNLARAEAEIRQMLITTALNGVRDFGRQRMKLERGEVDGEALAGTVVVDVAMNMEKDLPPAMRRYLRELRKGDTVVAIHERLARETGRSCQEQKAVFSEMAMKMRLSSDDWLGELRAREG